MTPKVPARYRNLARWLDYLNRTDSKYRRARTEEMTAKPLEAVYLIHVSPRCSVTFTTLNIVDQFLSEIGWTA